MLRGVVTSIGCASPETVAAAAQQSSSALFGALSAKDCQGSSIPTLKHLPGTDAALSVAGGISSSRRRSSSRPSSGSEQRRTGSALWPSVLQGRLQHQALGPLRLCSNSSHGASPPAASQGVRAASLPRPPQARAALSSTCS